MADGGRLHPGRTHRGRLHCRLLPGGEHRAELPFRPRVHPARPARRRGPGPAHPAHPVRLQREGAPPVRPSTAPVGRQPAEAHPGPGAVPQAPAPYRAPADSGPGRGGHSVRPRQTPGRQGGGVCGPAHLRGPGRDLVPERLGGAHLRRSIRRRPPPRPGRRRNRRRHDGRVASEGGRRRVRLGRYELTLEPRPALPAIYAVLTAVVAILLALALSSFLFLSADASLLGAYRAVFSYAFFNPRGILATVQRAIYLLFCTYAFLVPLRAGLWNIGLPGQVFAGALAAFAVPFVLGALEPQTLAIPPWLLILLMVASAAAAGAAVGGFAGILRARLQVNEILVTMMLNSIFFWLVAYMIKEGGL